jgi:hypothetical protein
MTAATTRLSRSKYSNIPCPALCRTAGLETPRISLNIDPNHRPMFGGADRDRTGGLLVANQALSQLSYSPMPVVGLLSPVVTKPADDGRLATND